MYIYHYTLRTRELGNTQSTDVSSSIVDASHSEQEQLKTALKILYKGVVRFYKRKARCCKAHPFCLTSSNFVYRHCLFDFILLLVLTTYCFTLKKNNVVF